MSAAAACKSLLGSAGETQFMPNPKHWKVLSYCIRADRAKWRCEWCGAENGKPHPITGSEVVLRVAHLDHLEDNCLMGKLVALCQRCHNRYNAHERVRVRRLCKDQEVGQGLLFEASQHTTGTDDE